MQYARVALVVGVAAIAGFIAAAWLWPGGGPTPQAPGSASAPAGPETAAAAPARAGELSIESGGTLEIDSASLDPGRPVVLRLALGEPSRTEEARPVRIAAVDGRVLEGQARLGDDRLDARFEVDPAFLTPGRYMVEVKTTEQSHFPLRRYVIEVR